MQKNKTFPDLTGILLNQSANLLLIELGKISSFNRPFLTNKFLLKTGFLTIDIEAVYSDSANFLPTGKKNRRNCMEF